MDRRFLCVLAALTLAACAGQHEEDRHRGGLSALGGLLDNRPAAYEPPVQSRVASTSFRLPATVGGQCESATAYLPLANAGSIQTPSHLAGLIEQSLALDPTGGRHISGTNMTPAMYLTSVNRAKLRVTGVAVLPAYLRSLKAVSLPSGRTYRMTRVKVTVGRDCVKTYELDTSEGFARGPHPGEQAWIDPNDSSIVFAQDCTNSPFEFVQVNGPSVIAEPLQSSVTEYCLWVRVREGEQRQFLKLRRGSLSGEVLRHWQPGQLNWQRGPRSGWYARVCLTEAELGLGDDLVLCNENNHNVLRAARDFSLIRANPDFPIDDAARLGDTF